VLTFHDINHTKEKGKLTPFALLNGKEGWDAYLNRVKACTTSLRNKKVQLLTRQDAPELVQRYTALAETAWISKLAQTIANLHFGWTNGYDENGQKRVVVVSGGLTARVRRKYGLDKLLYTDTTDPEVLAKKVKNREDKRHHALDAMVLTFIPQWARDVDKEGFFRFPPGFRDDTGHEDYLRVRGLFKVHISKVMPRFLTYERPELADTIYGARTDKAGTVIVQRVKVALLAQQPAGQQKTKFDLDYLGVQIKAVRDPKIRQQLIEKHSKSPNEAEWNAFCAELRQQCKDGSLGARIIYVTQNLDKKPIEFKDLSKDGRGAFRTTDQKHRGQFAYLDQAGKPNVEPVRVFESVIGVGNALRARPNFREMVGFFESYCLVEIQQAVRHMSVELPPGKYKLNTMKQDGRAQLTSASGIKSPEISLKKLLASGFRRID
jgi:CRISPR-associated endonuclease Csn1